MALPREKACAAWAAGIWAYRLKFKGSCADTGALMEKLLNDVRFAVIVKGAGHPLKEHTVQCLGFYNLKVCINH